MGPFGLTPQPFRMESLRLALQGPLNDTLRGVRAHFEPKGPKGDHRGPKDPRGPKGTQGDPRGTKGIKGTQGDPKGPKGAFGALWGMGPWGYSEAISNGKEFRVEGLAPDSL